MVYIGITGCLGLLLFSWIKLRDIIAPPFILSAVWTVIYIGLLFRKNTVDLSSVYYLSFFFSLCFFVFGFFFVVRNKNKKRCYAIKERKSYLTFNRFFGEIILLVLVILFFLFLIKVRVFVSTSYIFNFWHTINIGKEMGAFNEGTIFSYLRNTIISFSVVCSIVFFSNPTKKNMIYFLISIVMASFFSVTAGNRGTIIMLILAVFFSYMIVKNHSNKKALFILMVVIALVFTVFIVFAFFKYVYEDQSNIYNFIMKQIRVYFSTSTIAFVEWIKTFNNYFYGINTFRFFAAVLSSIGYDIEVPSLVQEFIWVYGDSTNVYTVLHYYAKDFGLVYALIIQLILGMIHGFFYEKSILYRGINPFFIAVQSLLYFPLINQFFDDKYFSIVSTWIQFLFWIWLFTRRGFIITDRNKT